MPIYYLSDCISILAVNEFDVIHVGSQNEYEDPFSIYPSELASDMLMVYEQGKNNWLTCGKLNDFFLNSLDKIRIGSTTYVAAIIDSTEPRAVRIEVDMPGDSKLWINREIVFIALEEQKKGVINVKLQMGINTVFAALNPRSDLLLPPYIYLQIYAEELFADKSMFENMQRDIVEHKCIVAARFCEKHVEMMLLPNTQKTGRIILPLFVNDRAWDNGEKNQYDFKKVYKIPLNENDWRRCVIYTQEPFWEIYCHVDSDYVQQISEEALLYLQEFSENNQIPLRGQLRQLKGRLVTRLEQFFMICQIEKAIGIPGSDILQDKIKCIYYLSQLDNTPQEIRVTLPKHGCPEEGYPLVVCLSVDWYDSYLFDYQFDYCLVANLPGRGVLGGGYISEYAYLEALDILYSSYSINKKRIYFIGKSNGGYAVWTISLCHPDLAAAIFPISGYPIINSLENISNSAIYNAVSDKDVCYANGRHKAVKHHLSSHKSYAFTEVSGILHHSLSDYKWFDMEKFFLSCELNDYPEQVKFTTERGCYMKSYWVRLHGIRFGSTKARVCAQMVTKRQIDIEVEGATGLTIEMPKKIDDETVVICINQEKFVLRCPTPAYLHFSADENNIYYLSDDPQKPDMAKGMGILAVYRTPLRILIPDNADDLELRAAKAFATPHSNGYFEWIDTNYPIVTPSNLSIDDRHHSLVIINLPRSQKEELFSGSFSPNIEVCEDGFAYKDVFFSGSYCVMQIMEHPIDQEKCILLVDTNDTKLLRRNMFSRKIVIPFYQDGINPIWNNSAIILLENRYLSCYEWGQELADMV